jgi:hypothetical protein
MTFSINFKPLVKLLFSIVLLSLLFYTAINNIRDTVPSIKMYSSPGDTLVTTPTIHK